MTIKGNTSYGISVNNNSGAKLENVEITENGENVEYACSIGIYHAGFVNVRNSVIYANHGPGIDMTGGCVMKMEGNNRVHSNQGYGVGIHNSSNARFYPGTSITNNGGYGINCNSTGEVTRADIDFGDNTNDDASYHTNKGEDQACGL